MTRSGRRPLAAVPEPGSGRAIAYVRVSAVMGREELHSPDLQLRAIRDLLVRRGLVEVDVVEDIDVSGRHFQREGIQAVLARARAGDVDVVALYDLSRLGRNTGESLRVVSELRDAGVSVASTVEQIDDSPEGQFMLGQFLGMAQLYSDQIGRRWSETARYRVERGLFHGGKPPHGYQLVPGVGLEPDPVAAPAAARVFERYAAGEALSVIARDYNRERGMARATAINTIKRMLRNPIYIGKVRLNGREFRGVHQALVDEDVWARVAARLDVDAKTPPRRLAVAYALTGLVVCAHCGYHLQHHGPGPKGAAYRRDVARLNCQRYTQFRDCPAGGVGTPAVAQVEAAVLDQVLELAADLKRDTSERARRAARRGRAGAEIRRMTRELADTRAARGRLAVDFARRVVDERAYRLADAELAAAEDRVVAALGEARATVAAPEGTAFVAAAERLRELWPVMTPPEQNRALKALIARVVLRRATYYREPVADRILVEPR